MVSRPKLRGHRVVARVTLDVAVRREFDYLVPTELESSVHEGTRVKVPFGPREVMGVVTKVLDESPHGNLREIIKTIGAQALVGRLLKGQPIYVGRLTAAARTGASRAACALCPSVWPNGTKRTPAETRLAAMA